MSRAAVLALALTACGSNTPPGFSSGTAVTSVSGTTSGGSSSGEASSTGSSDGSGDGSESSGSSSTGIRHDVGAAMDYGPGQPEGCKGKLDILFVISRQGTMDEEQPRLLASFPGFIDTLEEELEDFDLHILTANPDGKWPAANVCEAGANQCKDYWPNCGPNALDYQCGVYPDLMTACDEKLGAGLIFNTGGYAANKLCALHGGNRYIVDGEPDLQGAFECIAKAGISGGTAAMGDAMIAALSPKLNGPGGCNEGFLRDDALLFVVLITDWSDDGSQTYDKAQYDAIVAAKGDPGAVVMLAIVRNPPGEEPKEDCVYDAPSYGIFEALLARFPHAVFGDTCAPNYAPFFAEAAEKIGEACGSFVPQ